MNFGVGDARLEICVESTFLVEFIIFCKYTCLVLQL